MRFRDFKYKFRITPLSRLTKYIEILDESVKVNDPHDRKKIDFLTVDMKRTCITVRVFSGIRFFFYLLLYASIISGIGQLVFFQELTSHIVGVSAVIGTTFSAGMVLILNNFINMYFEHVRTTTSHMIAIYTKHDHKNNPRLEEYIKALI